MFPKKIKVCIKLKGLHALYKTAKAQAVSTTTETVERFSSEPAGTMRLITCNIIIAKAMDTPPGTAFDITLDKNRPFTTSLLGSIASKAPGIPIDTIPAKVRFLGEKG